MPEIAEVRTVRRILNERITNKNIKDINVIYDKTIDEDINEFKSHLINKKILEVTNYGKYLFFNVGEYTIVSHLRMEGKFAIKKISDELVKHEHVIFNLDDNLSLRYVDTRKFGRMKTIKTNEKENYIKEKNLGFEPNDARLTGTYLYELIHNKETPIKNVLLDQSIICGLGNIYVNEVLFASNIYPNKKTKKITKTECEKIVLNSKLITDEATKYNGTTIHTFSALGVEGEYQSHLKIHGQKKCIICGSEVKKIKVGGRGTYYCPNCQKN